MTFEEKFSNIFDKFETVVSDRLGNIEAEVTQLRTTLLVTELARRLINQAVQARAKSTLVLAPRKRYSSIKEKGCEEERVKVHQSSAIVNLPPVNLSQSSAIDLRLGTQDFLESCMKNLSQDTFVKGFDPSQVKAEDSLDWLEPPTSLKMSPRRFTDRDIELAGADEPDSCLAFDARFFHNTGTSTPVKFTVLPYDGTILHCKLPQPAITSLTSVENMHFMPLLRLRTASSTSLAALWLFFFFASPRQSEDDTVRYQVDHTRILIEYLLPAYTGRYDYGPPPLDGTQQQQLVRSRIHREESSDGTEMQSEVHASIGASEHRDE
ncbi:hypothetical protein Bca52824_090785 [Brassica carinata]|uniref:Uncharacterized protein n=1 Tax=Brassica carinata TaxID=52824 RepID=A0A8X7TG38_BRACI|nr:hypothetical protein Bca52824_090785 [Brassica carinata]